MSDPRFSAEVGIVGVNRFDGLWSNKVKQIWPQIYLSEYVLLEWALPFLCRPFFLFLPSPVLWESTVSFSFAERRSYEDHKIRTRQSTVRRFKIKVHFPYLAYFHWWNRRGEKCMIHLTWNPMSGTHKFRKIWRNCHTFLPTKITNITTCGQPLHRGQKKMLPISTHFCLSFGRVAAGHLLLL